LIKLDNKELIYLFNWWWNYHPNINDGNDVVSRLFCFGVGNSPSPNKNKLIPLEWGCGSMSPHKKCQRFWPYGYLWEWFEIQPFRPIRIWIRIYLPHPLVYCMWRLNGRSFRCDRENWGPVSQLVHLCKPPISPLADFTATEMPPIGLCDLPFFTDRTLTILGVTVEISPRKKFCPSRGLNWRLSDCQINYLIDCATATIHGYSVYKTTNI
jgi:hypothetical protein